LYINSPGGSVSAGMAIYDTMQFLPCDVSTVCFGMAASMGAFLLGAGTKGKRKSLPNARIMIHQPLGGASGNAVDVEIQAKEILFIKACMNTYMSEYTGQPMDKLAEDTDRDFYMMPNEVGSRPIIRKQPWFALSTFSHFFFFLLSKTAVILATAQRGESNTSAGFLVP
jgi:ATP-dependent Clp protease protease subunit